VGLGLVISKMIVQQYDGAIDFDSDPGEGSRFFFKVKLGSLRQDNESGVNQTYDFNSAELHDYWVCWDKREILEEYFDVGNTDFIRESTEESTLSPDAKEPIQI